MQIGKCCPLCKQVSDKAKFFRRWPHIQHRVGFSIYRETGNLQKSKEPKFPPQCKIETEFWEVYEICKQPFVCLPIHLSWRTDMLWKCMKKREMSFSAIESCTCWIIESPFYVVTWKNSPRNQGNKFNSD